MAHKLTLASCIALCLWGCEGDPPLLLVDLKTDWLPGREFAVVRTVVAGSAPRVPDAPAFAGADFLSGVRIAEIEGLEGRDATLEVSLVTSDEGTLASRLVQVAVNTGTATGITVLMTRSCAGVACPGPGDDPSAVACVGAVCVLPTCTEETPEQCGDPMCGVDTDCPPLAGCSVGRCIAGSCFATGCTPSMDGGVMDAGADAEGGMVDTGVALDSGIDSAPADADTGAAVVDPTMLGPFGTPTRVSWTTNNDDDPSFTADLRELFFNRPGPGGMNDIWLSTRSGPAVPWGPPVHVPELSDSAAEESAPRVTRDGLSFFVSRAVAGRGFDILVANRSSRTAPWSPLAPVADLNSTQDERCVALYGGGTGVILHSNRPSGGVDDLFEFRRPTPAAPWGPGVALDELNTVVDDAQPWVTIDGLHVYFTTARDGGRDIYSASRPDLGTPFGAITSVTDLNNPDRDSDLVMSDDGRYVIFESRRGGAGGLWEASR